ncbi:MAG: ATP-grasp domain-containing protein [Oscillospiraceae bacterium]|nr:ATP-grasp domain-containing protein [Oscillospiraceae bacterium]
MDELGQKNDDAVPLGRLRVGLIYNLKKNIISYPPDAEAEFDDIDTISALKGAIESSGYAVELLEADERLPVRLSRNRPDIAFNIAEGVGGRGREAQVPAICNFFGIPYTGSDEATMCIAMDKALAKKLLSAHRVPTPNFRIIKPGDRLSVRGLGYPVIVKPVAEGSGKGITGLSIAGDADALRAALQKALDDYSQDMLVEEFIAGREFTVGILGNGRSARVFAPMEIIFRDRAREIYSYEVKRNFKDHVDYKCPPDLSAGEQAEIMRLAQRIYDILACRDCARIDFRMDGSGRFYFIEINPLPGLAPGYSDFPILAEFCGVGYNELIAGILESALERHGLLPARR